MQRATDINSFMEGLKTRNSGEIEFLQAVSEVAEDVIPFMEKHPRYIEEQVLERLCEPDRIVSFRVCWHDDKNNIRVNRGYRVQNNNAIGPYKGGLRFHPSVNLSILKFLAFEQTFKNSLTGLPIGGGKGGSDFNPRGKSDHEIMRFCQSFMTELYRHVGHDTDVPAGDIGVGAREIGYMFGQYKRITNNFTGVLTGKGLDYGGSEMRTEATGYGCVYFLIDMLKTRNQTLEGKEIAISGSGNVATHAAEQCLMNGAKVITLSDSEGIIHVPEGICSDKLAWIKHLKNVERGRISKAADEFPGVKFHKGVRPWSLKCDVALPCATQNEISVENARELLGNGCIAVSEGANMPTDNEGIKLFIENKILFGPAKAANAGGVAMSGLEMSQNAGKRSWGSEELSVMLRDIMEGIHTRCVEEGQEKDFCNYAKGANIAGFRKVADAVLAFGVV